MYSKMKVSNSNLEKAIKSLTLGAAIEQIVD